MSSKHIVSFSGGKDSTAMLLRMIELKMPIDEIVFADTGLEFPEIYEHIKNIEKIINRKITIIKTDQTWDKWFYGIPKRGKAGERGLIRGFPLTLFPCWWSRESKFKVLDKYCKGHIRYIGIAIDEPRRLKKKENYVYPLADWKWAEKDCIEYLRSKGILKEIHEKFKRTGCWCCPKQNLESLKILMKDYPKLWEKLKQMEKDSPQGFKPNFSLIKFEKENSP